MIYPQRIKRRPGVSRLFGPGIGLGTGGGWTPLHIPGLALWLDAAYGLYQETAGASAATPATADGDPVGTWKARTGQYYIAPTTAARPTYRANGGKPYLFADGVDDELQGPTPAHSDRTIGTAARCYSLAETRVFALEHGRFSLASTVAGAIQLSNAGISSVAKYPSGVVGTTAVRRHMATAANSGGSATGTLYLDGTQKVQASGPVTSPDRPGRAFNAQGSSFFGWADLYSIIVYSRVLSPAELAALDSYLARLS